jgi:hypothetical protein
LEETHPICRGVIFRVHHEFLFPFASPSQIQDHWVAIIDSKRVEVLTTNGEPCQRKRFGFKVEVDVETVLLFGRRTNCPINDRV